MTGVASFSIYVYKLNTPAYSQRPHPTSTGNGHSLFFFNKRAGETFSNEPSYTVLLIWKLPPPNYPPAKGFLHLELALVSQTEKPVAGSEPGLRIFIPSQQGFPKCTLGTLVTIRCWCMFCELKVKGVWGRQGCLSRWIYCRAWPSFIC